MPNLAAMVDGPAIAPEAALWLFALVALLIEWLRPRTVRPDTTAGRILSAEAAATTGLVAALLLLLATTRTAPRTAFSQTIVQDPLAWYFTGLCIISSLILIPSSWSYMRARADRVEFYTLLLLATSAMTLLVESNDLIMMFLALEFLSITSYVLVGYLKGNRRSSEAAIKYFLFGAICSSLMLYGMSLIYGLTGSTNILVISNARPSFFGTGRFTGLEALLVVTFMAGIGFKISAWPFHMWAPDAYEGAPTPVTAFLAVGPKLAGIAVFIRVAQTLFTTEPSWPILLALMAIVTMTWGNLAALSQTNAKRLLAYSSIAQAGYLLVGVLALSMAGSPGAHTTTSQILLIYGMRYAAPSVLIYAAAYLVMNLGAFVVLIEVERLTGSAEIEAFSGLSTKAPMLAGAMTIFLLSLGGIPLTAGFLGKLYLFGSAVAGAAYGHDSVLWIVASVGVANSVVSIYYYFRIIQPMWLQESTIEGPVSRSAGLVATGLAVLTLGLGIFGQALIEPGQDFDTIYSEGPLTAVGLQAPDTQAAGQASRRTGPVFPGSRAST
jgi:proton-translocating NADH-quinone oxidoreductase chain N